MAALVRGEMVQTHMDMAGALALAAAHGVEAAVAAELLSACAEGIAMGLAERRKDA